MHEAPSHRELVASAPVKVMSGPAPDRAPGTGGAAGPGRRRYAGKRILDLAILVLVVGPALVIGIVSAIAILLDDGRPVLFRQVRVGHGGHPFVLLKLRTMPEAQASIALPRLDRRNPVRSVATQAVH